jgi:hypothetical protein
MPSPRRRSPVSPSRRTTPCPYTLPGYLGSDANGTELVYIRAGAVTERVTLELTPFARLEGTVLDEEGRPRIPSA